MQMLSPKARRIVQAILTDDRRDVNPENYVAEFAPRARRDVSAAISRAASIGAIAPDGFYASGKPRYRHTPHGLF